MQPITKSSVDEPESEAPASDEEIAALLARLSEGDFKKIATAIRTATPEQDNGRSDDSLE